MKFKQPPAAAKLAAVTTATGATYRRPLGGAGWFKLEAPTQSVAQLLATLSADADVAKVEPDYIGHPTAVRASAVPDRITPMFELPNDPFYSSQWAFENTGQAIGGITGTPGADINAPAAWDLSTGSKSVVLVNFDTGIDFNNPDLAPNVGSAPSAYTFTEGGNVYNCPQGSHGFNAIDSQSGCAGQEYDNGGTNGHGTLQAGAMGAATDNGIGIAGTDWNATMLSISICTDVCDSATAVTGIDAALQIASHFGLHLAAGNFSHGGLDDSASRRDDPSRDGDRDDFCREHR
ncbi:MAG TPA: S8 family serine peptidase [Terriglobales bacterium]|nr:S8 family serine peptidase [Terriglobales bacterium]